MRGLFFSLICMVLVGACNTDYSPPCSLDGMYVMQGCGSAQVHCTGDSTSEQFTTPRSVSSCINAEIGGFTRAVGTSCTVTVTCADGETSVITVPFVTGMAGCSAPYGSHGLGNDFYDRVCPDNGACCSTESLDGATDALDDGAADAHVDSAADSGAGD